MRQKHKREIVSRDKYHPDVYAQLEKNSCRLYLRASQLLSREYYAEYALMQYYFTKDIHSITCEELQQSAVRFYNMIYPQSKDEGGIIIRWEMFLKNKIQTKNEIAL